MVVQSGTTNNKSCISCRSCYSLFLHLSGDVQNLSSGSTEALWQYCAAKRRPLSVTLSVSLYLCCNMLVRLRHCKLSGHLCLTTSGLMPHNGNCTVDRSLGIILFPSRQNVNSMMKRTVQIPIQIEAGYVDYWNQSKFCR